MELDPAVIRDIREACADVLGPPEVPPITVAGGSETGVAGLPPAAVAALGVITDSDIWRFYVGRKRDMKATVESVRQYAEWRRDSGANEMLKIPFPDFQLFRRVVPHSYHKRDLEGHPIEIDRIGGLNMPNITRVFDDDLMTVRHIWGMEFSSYLLQEASTARGAPVTKVTLIMDMEHISMAPNGSALELFRAASRIDQTYYPERLHKAFLINAPLIFKGLWAIVSPWLDPVTRAKFHIVGSDYRETLLQHIAPDCLPVEYGGTCTCGNTSEPGFTPADTCVPPMCTLSGEEMMAAAGFRTVALAAGAVDTVDLAYVPDGNAVIWQWNAEDRDVLFKAEFIPMPEEAAAAGSGAAGAVTLHEESKEKVGKGWYLPQVPGRVVLTFSNAHSRFTSKNVHVRLSGGHSVAECRLRSLTPFSNPAARFADTLTGK